MGIPPVKKPYSKCCACIVPLMNFESINYYLIILELRSLTRWLISYIFVCFTLASRVLNNVDILWFRWLFITTFMEHFYPSYNHSSCAQNMESSSIVPLLLRKIPRKQLYIWSPFIIIGRSTTATRRNKYKNVHNLPNYKVDPRYYADSHKNLAHKCNSVNYLAGSKLSICNSLLISFTILFYYLLKYNNYSTVKSFIV